MPFYHTLGEIPRKRHTQFRNKNGALYSEHLMGIEGFTGLASLLYRINPPTAIKDSRVIKQLSWVADNDTPLRPRHFFTAKVKPGGSPVLDRIPLMFNGDLAISIAKPDKEDEFIYRNGQGDEVIYISKGSGVLESLMGLLPYRQGDYLVIPRGIEHRFNMDEGENTFLIFESRGYVRTPKRYRNQFGQLMEHSPFCERDIRVPEELPAFDLSGDFPVIVKRDNLLHEIIYANHPFDVVGWDGYYFPWAFNIEDFEPVVGSLHQPPPVHQTFESDGWVICSFTPRPYDFHPEAIPAPYNHSNVDSDEMIYYASEEFMSRKGVQFGSITLHPDGIPHGPHPGTVEKSITADGTDEYAVMADTFHPLKVAKAAVEIEDDKYFRSWLED